MDIRFAGGLVHKEGNWLRQMMKKVFSASYSFLSVQKPNFYPKTL